MRLFELMVAGSMGVAIAGCALDEAGATLISYRPLRDLARAGG